MIRTLIVDDEPLARAGLWVLLEADPEVEVIGECTNGRDAVEAIRAQRPDLVFLDVAMPDLDGFGILSELEPSEIPVVIFVTAYDEFALRAFEANAIDYLLKPFDRDRLARALRRAKALVAQGRISAMREGLAWVARYLATGQEWRTAASGERIILRDGEKTTILRLDEIDWIEASGNYVVVHATGRINRTRDTLTGFLARLDPSRFVRVSRSAAVNADRVRELRGVEGGQLDVVLRSGDIVPSSRRYRNHVREFFGEPPGR
jgi:two-component system LytT family response regulator